MNDTPRPKPVISISRRTDIPRWHSSWLLQALQEKRASYVSPAKTIASVSLDPKETHSLVFWSKDYRSLLESGELRQLLKAYSVYFHFTVTGLGGSFWEPKSIPPAEALVQLGKLVRLFGPERMNWRFDPIVFWREEALRSNAERFESLASFVASVGIRRCTFSFAEWYGKCVRRATKIGLAYFDPPIAEKLEWLERIARAADSAGIELYSCAQSNWVGRFGIGRGSCVDARLLSSLRKDSEPASPKKDSSQRSQCGCTESIDIGSYSQGCHHGCIYCYANPIV